jgi:hypothetical protein
MANRVEIEIRGDDQSRAAFNSLLKNVKKGTKQTGSMLAKFRDLAIVATAAKRALAALGQQVKAGFADAVRQEQAQATLAIALKTKVTPQWEAALDKINKYADGVQKTTAVSADLVRELARVGAEFGLTTEQIIVGTDAVLDRALQAQRAPLDMMRIFAKSIVGISEGWAELGVKIDKTATKTEKFNQAIAQMATGAQKVIGSLPTTAIAQLGNELSDLRGLLVRVGVATGAFQLVVKTVTGWVSKLKAAVADPAAFNKFVEGIDKTITAIGTWAIRVAAVYTLIVGKLLQGLEVAAKGFVKLANIFGVNEAQIAELEARVEGYGNALGAAKTIVDEMGKAETATGRAYLRSKQALAALHGEFSLGADTVLNWSESLFEAAKETNFFSAFVRSDLVESIRLAIEKFGQFKAATDSVMDAETIAKWQEGIAVFTELMTEAGREFGSVISTGIQEALDEDVGAREAMDRMGENLRKTLIAHFSDAALAPINRQFGLLATALAKPFQIVGNVISKVLNALIAPIATAIEFLVTKLLTMMGLQKLLVGTGLAGVATIAASASGLSAVWGAAATAAAIATLGAALAFAVPAQAAIAAGAAQAKALAIPAAEGALILPTPGGTIMQVAEAGEAEVIAPVSKLAGLLGGGGGGDVNLTVEIASFTAGDEGSVESFFEEVGLRILEGRLLGNSGPGGLNL